MLFKACWKLSSGKGRIKIIMDLGKLQGYQGREKIVRFSLLWEIWTKNYNPRYCFSTRNVIDTARSFYLLTFLILMLATLPIMAWKTSFIHVLKAFSAVFLFIMVIVVSSVVKGLVFFLGGWGEEEVVFFRLVGCSFCFVFVHSSAFLQMAHNMNVEHLKTCHRLRHKVQVGVYNNRLFLLARLFWSMEGTSQKDTNI